MQHQIFALLIAVLSYAVLPGQTIMAPYLGGVLRNENALPGIEFGADFRFVVKSKGAFVLGLGAQLAEGNPNFDPSAPGKYNLEYGDYSPEFQAFIGSPFLFDFLIELPVKSATLVQYDFQAGYRHQLKHGWSLESAVSLVYVNKTFIAEVIPNFDIEYTPFGTTESVPFSIDYAVVVMLRYWDITPNVTVNKTLLDRKAWNLDVYSSANIAIRGQHWFALGLQAEL